MIVRLTSISMHVLTKDLLLELTLDVILCFILSNSAHDDNMLIDYRSSVVDKLDELIEDKITVFAITNSHSEVFLN